MSAGLALAAIPTALVLLLGAAFSSDGEQVAGYTVDVSQLPPLAQHLLPDIESQRSKDCPQLPLVWLLAEVQAESGWNPRAYSNAGAAGLLQMLPASWAEATGGAAWSVVDGPSDDHPVWDPPRHLAAAIPWMCGHLRDVADHLARSGKPTSPLDALAVCHIAGCARVVGSRTGVPVAGEAGCSAFCAAQVADYLAAIHRYVEQYSRPAPVAAPVGGSAEPFTAGAPGCILPDPTGTGGCVTLATAWMLRQADAIFPETPISCWDAHAWNPRSDHPSGKACDFTIGRIGTFPGPEDTAHGWSMAQWFQANSASLRIAYIIWQGRIWSAVRTEEGWRAYTGGGVYDPSDPTGGHYDHVHVSMAQ